MFQESPLFNTVRRIGLAALLIWSGFPIFFLVISAFKLPKEIFQFPPRLMFRPTIVNFVSLAHEWPQFFTALLTSTLVALGASILTILLAAPAGYALSRFRSRVLSGSAFFILAVRMYPPIVLSVPLFPIFSQLGLVDTLWVLILLYSTFFVSLSTWLMKTYMDEVPIELEEAAAIDGANAFQRLTKVVIPLSVHGLVATGIFVSIFAWKEFTLANIFAGQQIRTAPLVLTQMLSPVSGVDWGPLFAASTIQLMPILGFVWLVQAYLIQGLRTGGVKG